MKETRSALEKNDTFNLRSLSNQTINTASLTQDPDNIAVAVIVYSLSKIMERLDYRQLPGWKKFYKNTLLYLDKSIQDIENKDYAKFREDFRSIRGSVENLSGKLKNMLKRFLEMQKLTKLLEFMSMVFQWNRQHVF